MILEKSTPQVLLANYVHHFFQIAFKITFGNYSNFSDSFLDVFPLRGTFSFEKSLRLRVKLLAIYFKYAEEAGTFSQTPIQPKGLHFEGLETIQVLSNKSK